MSSGNLEFDKFQEELIKKYDDKSFVKKLNKQKDNLEKLLDCPVLIDLDVETKFGVTNANNISPYDWDYHKSVIGELNDYHIDLDNKILFCDGDIFELSSTLLEAKVKTIERLCEDTEKEITIKLNSFGGDIYAMFAIIDFNETYGDKLSYIGTGKIMSAGAFILICSKNRKMTRNSYMMIHDASTFIDGSYKEIKVMKEHLDDIMSKIYVLLEKNSNKSYQWWEEKLQHDLFLNAEQALELGLIDEIV